MSNVKKFTYTLLAIISFSLISASAQAGGISIRIGGYGHDYHHGHNAHHPSTYYYSGPFVTYLHHYRPYYGYRHNSYYSGHHGSHHSAYGNYSHHNSGHNRFARYRNGHDTRHSGHNRLAGTSSKKHRR